MTHRCSSSVSPPEKSISALDFNEHCSQTTLDGRTLSGCIPPVILIFVLGISPLFIFKVTAPTPLPLFSFNPPLFVALCCFSFLLFLLFLLLVDERSSEVPQRLRQLLRADAVSKCVCSPTVKWAHTWYKTTYWPHSRQFDGKRRQLRSDWQMEGQTGGKWERTGSGRF